MHWTRTKRLIVVLIIIFVVITLFLCSWRILSVHYRSKETSILHQVQDRQVYLSNVWSKCFHSNRVTDCEGKGVELTKETVVNGERLHQLTDRTSCRVGVVAQNGECMPCPEGTFALEQWVVCVPLLSCNELNYDIQIGSTLYQIGNWALYAARWKNYDVIYALFLSSDDGTVFDFKSVQSVFPHHNLLYPIGVCDEEKAKPKLLFAWSDDILGKADKLDSILTRKAGCDNEIVRFKLAIDYVQILVHLHTNITGNHTSQFVLCNSHSLSALLSQFLVTADFKLIVGAFDNLPVLKVSATNDKENKIKCSQKELKGSFIAPEQKWPYQSSKVFNPTQQPGYTEKTDIWKIPDVTRVLLGRDSEKIVNLLEVMHRKCKNLEPSKRPTAQQVLHEYQFVWTFILGLNPLCQ